MILARRQPLFRRRFGDREKSGTTGTKCYLYRSFLHSACPIVKTFLGLRLEYCPTTGMRQRFSKNTILASTRMIGVAISLFQK